MEGLSSKLVIMLTSTVYPNVDKHLVLADPELRKEQYRASFSWWLKISKELNAQLAIVETSKASLEDFFRSEEINDSQNIFFTNYEPTPSEILQGKGAIEISACKHLMDTFPEVFGLQDTVYKITGRLVISNYKKILKILSPSEVSIRSTINNLFVDTRCIGASTYTWKNILLNTNKLVDDDKGIYLEHTTALAIHEAVTNQKVEIVRFADVPIIIGTSGSSGQSSSPETSKPKRLIIKCVSKLTDQLAKRLFY